MGSSWEFIVTIDEARTPLYTLSQTLIHPFFLKNIQMKKQKKSIEFE